MPFEQLSFEDVVVNRLKSRFRTLDGYRRTSSALHGRPVESVAQLAAGLLDELAQAEKEHPGSTEISRWAAKIREYVKQYGIEPESE